MDDSANVGLLTVWVSDPSRLSTGLSPWSKFVGVSPRFIGDERDKFSPSEAKLGGSLEGIEV